MGPPLYVLIPLWVHDVGLLEATGVHRSPALAGGFVLWRGAVASVELAKEWFNIQHGFDQRLAGI